MKNIYRAFLYLIYKKRRHHKLIIPVLFLLLEIGMAVSLNWELFGEKYTFRNDRINSVVHNPLIAVSFLHSDRVLYPLGELSTPRTMFSFYNKDVVIKAVCTLLSLIAAYAGIFISFLWINRFFHENSLDIVWWTWPACCISAHFMFFTLPQIDIIEQSMITIAF